MSSKVKCTCGWSWNKSDSSKKDMYICHECGRDNSNNMKNGGWLDNYNDSQASAPEGFQGDGYSNVGRDYSPAWGGQFQMGGSVYPVNYVPQAQDGKRLNPFTYPQPDHYSMNPFLVRDPQHGIFVGGINPTYSTKDFSIGASAVGVGNKDFIEPIVDYGIKGSYNPTDSLSINANISKENVGAGMSYRFENGGEIDYPRTKGIPSNGPYAKKTMASAQLGKNIKIKDERLKGQVTKDQLEDRNVFSKNQLSFKKPVVQKQIKKAQKDAANSKVVVFAESPMEDSTYDMWDDKVNQVPELKKLQDEYRNSVKSMDSVAMSDKTYKTLYSKLANSERKVNELIDRYNSEDPRVIEAFDEYNNLSESLDNYKEVALRDKLSPYKKKLNKLNAKFYQSPLNPKIMDSTFYKEAQNVKNFYNRTDPNTKVDVVPLYGDEELMQRKLKGMSQFDKVAIFGHSGDKLAGIANNDIAKYLSDSRVNDC